ncbi:hypothetical protein [Larkinella soli]|nr:hypothetical protein [Larkinella soli]
MFLTRIIRKYRHKMQDQVSPGRYDRTYLFEILLLLLLVLMVIFGIGWM